MNSNRKLGNMANNFLDGHSEEVKHTKYAVSTTTTLNNMTTKFYGKKATSGLGNMNRHFDIQLALDNLPEEKIVRKPIVKDLVAPSNNLINIKSYENINLSNNVTDFTKLNLNKIYIIVNNHVLNEGYIYKNFFESNNITSEVVNLNGEIISDTIYRDVLDNNDKILLIFGVTTISNPRILYNLKHKCLIYQIEQKNILNASDLYVLKDFLKDMPNIIEFSHNNNFYSKKIDLKLPLIQLQTINNKKDIDILFYGSLSIRRKNILKQLYQFKKYKIKYVYNTFGNELLNLINRSKIVLNLHSQNDSFLEVFRINLAITYNTHIISESPINKNEKYLYDLYKKLVFFIPQLDPYDNNNYNNLSKLIDKLLITNSINLRDKTDKINIINNISQKVLFENLNVMDSTINNLRKSNLDETLFHKYYLKLETTDNQIKYNIIKTNISDYFIERKYYAHLHCYDISKFNEIYGEYIETICRYFSVIVTYSIGNNTIDKNSELVILKIPNKGSDIGGKFCAVKYLNDNNILYEYILFLHSKSNPDTRRKYFKPLIDNLDDEFIKNINENDGYFLDIQWEIVGDKLKMISGNPKFADSNLPERNLLYRNRLLKYLGVNNNTNRFVEGNCYILSKKVINKLYTDPLLYNILNTETSFDYNWVNKAYNINGNIYEVYKKFRERKLSPRNQNLYDGYLEHVFERVVLNFCDNYKFLKLYNKINILIRNTYRPTYFIKCIDSILNQNYENYKVIMCYDDDYCLEYLEQYKNNTKIEIFKTTEVDKSNQVFYNLYCNQLLDKVENGWIIFLDDDDMFSNSNVLKYINTYLTNDNNLVFWKFKRPDRLIYPDIKLLKRDTIASCGYCFHSKYKNLSKWTAWQGGDYDYIKGLIQKNNFNKNFIDKVLTQTTFDEMKVGNFGQKEPYPKKKYSIIMAYFNRKEQTILTFNQFERLYGNKYDFEVVIVDDCSDENEKLSDIVNNYSFKIKYIELKNKTWINPVVPLNIAILNISQDVDTVIFQNPETFHCGDILNNVNNIKEDEYFVYPVFNSPSYEENENLKQLFEKNTTNYYYDFINKIDYKKYRGEWDNRVIDVWKGWLQHKDFNDRQLHFLTAISKLTLDKVGGFCNDMKDGLWYDDDDFLLRIKKVANCISIESNELIAIHQKHTGGSNENMKTKNDHELKKKNLDIMNNNIKNNIIYCYPKNILSKITKINCYPKNILSKITKINFIYFSWYDYYKSIYSEKINNFIDYIKITYPDISINLKLYPYMTFNKCDLRIKTNERKKFFHNYINQLEISNNILYYFDEITYCNLLEYYLEYIDLQKEIATFFHNIRYIISFSEIFKNDNLQTVGNNIYCKEFGNLFFKNSEIALLCNYENIKILKSNGIFKNIIYYPDLFKYNFNTVLTYKKKSIDILIYGNKCKSQSYRYLLIDKVKDYSKKKGYIFLDKSTETETQKVGIYGENLDKKLEEIKLVLHIPSFADLKTFPWAKCIKLFCKKVFVLIENNIEVEKMKLEGLNIATYDAKIENDILNKLDLYINNDNLRKSYIDSCYKFYTERFNKPSYDFLKILNQNENKRKTINYFKFNDKDFHSNQKEFIINILKNEYIIKEKLKFHFNTPLEENYFDFLKKYEKNEKNEDLFIFNAHDFWTIIQSVVPHNFNDIIKFLNNANYIYFSYEVISNENLEQIGCAVTPYQLASCKYKSARNCEINVISKYYYKDFYIKNKKFYEKYVSINQDDIVLTPEFIKIKLNVIKLFYQNAKFIFTSIFDNIKYLNKNNLKNIKYVPPIGFSEENNFQPIQQNLQLKYDIIFYGNYINNARVLPYRANIWDKVKKYSKINKIVYKEYDGNLTEDIKDEILSQTKIVLHIPSYPNLNHFPWQKTMELICKKIFIIIEECDDMYKLNLDKLIVFYKSGDVDDLNKKISYYLNNPEERKEITEKLFNYIKDEFNLKFELEKVLD